MKLLDLLLHPSELKAAVYFKYIRKPLYPRDKKSESPTLRRCYELLNHSSRSFSLVIQELHPELRDTIMIFYIVLRALDTIEDDTTIENSVKLPLLRTFDKILVEKEGWTFNGCSPNEKDRIVLEEFDKVQLEYHKLKPEYKEIIREITHRMGNGMADYIDLESQANYGGVKTIADYALYCHHVAGLIGEAVSKLAIIPGFGTNILVEKPQLHESMGQFLQRTNIIRDFREDFDEGRSFYPQEVWKKYAKSLEEFSDPKHINNAVQCVSELVALSLECVIDCLEYMQNVKEPSLFSFCAIPQVMAIATTELIFQNPKMFNVGTVKLRRGTTAKLVLESQTMAGVFAVFREYTMRIHLRNRADDPNFMRIEVLCGKIQQYIDKQTIVESFKQQKINEAQTAKNKDQFSDNLVLLSALAVLFFTCGLMAFIGYLGGARYDLVYEQVLDFFYEFQHGPGNIRPNSPYQSHVQSISAAAAQTAIGHADL